MSTRHDDTEDLVTLDLRDPQGQLLDELVLTAEQTEHLTALGNGDIEKGILEAVRISRLVGAQLPSEQFSQVHADAVLQVDIEDSQRATRH